MNMQNLSFVRQDMVAASPRPSGRGGTLEWTRKNLFNSWLSTLLTVGSVLTVAWLIVAVAPWLGNSVWRANSLVECRQVLGDAPGACWGVIRDRWPQLLFGFYPAHLYWRPVLAFALLFAALAPVLLRALPRRALWFSIVYPGIAYFLIWGGSLWFPISVYFGFAVGAGLFMLAARAGKGPSVGIAVIGASVWWVYAAQPISSLADGMAPIALDSIASRDVGGFLLSIIIGVTGIAMSLPLGILLALGRRSNLPLIHMLSVVFIEFIRGVPLITLLFTASLLLNYFLPPGTNFDLILRVVIMVTLFASAYMAEVIRGGLAALPKGQYEAAEALGLDYWKSQQLVILPQALKISIPGIVNSFIGLFKDTTLVMFIGLLDPIALAAAIRANTNWQGIYWELFIFIGAVFFVFCFSMSRYSQYLERRLKTDHR
ncbi:MULTISPECIES: amino acid ABC transporter permease [Rhizobium]|uniref:amino acid ABC transporter permease n=1 Tax=Rhizobium TaxID=379 RepID=UPI000EA96DB2|nr:MULTISPECIES: amino acid ABC transporter permease [Rhizobium]AYG70371.1 amino acid ABC transporter permease [Rhizobium sp. CCGE531]MBB6305734.1 general L-amino acid transport system permease protein [Rhizobium leucaenae]MDK4743763.1 amino acid ABC transporter permease [Rhizobium sp. CNPSo 3464]